MKPTITDSGICLDPRPYGLNCMMGSMTCDLCRYNFRYDDAGNLRCAGHWLQEESA